MVCRSCKRDEGSALSKVYQFDPGPVVLLTTTREDRANIMAMSWYMIVEFEPPLITHKRWVFRPIHRSIKTPLWGYIRAIKTHAIILDRMID
jgi:hypothetical protein